MTAERRLAVVVLNWNGRDDTLACLATLKTEIGAGDAVVVADNGSTDGSVATIRAAHPWATLIENGKNLGFAGGNNTAMAWALAQGFRWVMLLNNDAVLAPGSLAALLAHAETRPGVGAFQPLLVSAANPEIVDSAGHQVFRRGGANDVLMGRPVAEVPATPHSVFGACGAAALLRGDALRRVGLFDEELFILGEDVDLMFRIRLAGLDVELVPSVRVRHKRGISANASSPAESLRRDFWLRRNLVALALRYWPMRHLAANAWWGPRAARVWRLAKKLPGERCGPLWQKSLAMRGASRRRMRELGLDIWFRP